MTMLTTAQVSSSAPSAAFFARWADVASWPEWNTDTEWVRLDGDFRTGATGSLKPKGGPKVRFVVETLEPGREFTDVTRLFGTRLTFRHLVSEHAGSCHVKVTVSMTGPLRLLWTAILGKQLTATLAGDLDRLARVAERDVADGWVGSGTGGTVARDERA
jgi:hypothetical protein